MTLVTLVVRVSALGARDRGHVCNMGSEHHVDVFVTSTGASSAISERGSRSVHDERPSGARR
eukprot:6222359-Prymnesium_polylepis.1